MTFKARAWQVRTGWLPLWKAELVEEVQGTEAMTMAHGFFKGRTEGDALFAALEQKMYIEQQRQNKDAAEWRVL